MCMKRVLLICPSFNGYELEIIKEFERRGFDFVFIEDDSVSNNSPIYKRVSRTLYKKKVNNYYNKKFLEVKDVQFDYVLVVKGGEVTYDFINNLRVLQNAKFILYLWDSINNNRNALKLLRCFDKVYSFDQNDCDNYKFNFRAFFYTNHEITSCSKEYDLLFIGAFHSDRYSLLDKISRNISDGITTKFILFTTIFSYLLNRFFLKTIHKNNRIKFIFKRISLSESILLEDKSRAILDINHYNQSGLTTRAFDCINRKIKLITTNKNIKKYDFFNEENIQVIDRGEALIDLNFLTEHYVEIEQQIVKSYSVKAWANDILNIKEYENE